MKKLLLFLWAFLLPTIAFAQAGGAVVIHPFNVTNNNNQSSTVSVTNTFQSIFPADTAITGRSSCIVQNTGTNSMYVFFGPIASATIATSVKLSAGQATTCNNGTTVLKTQVSITGTATETFYAAQQ